MKFEFNWPSSFRKKLCFKRLMGLQYERPWLKDQPQKPMYSQFLIRLNISSKHNDIGFQSVFKKSTFQKISHLNALGSKIELDV